MAVLPTSPWKAGSSASRTNAILVVAGCALFGPAEVQACGPAPDLHKSLAQADLVQVGTLTFDPASKTAWLRGEEGSAIPISAPAPLSSWVGRSGVWFLETNTGLAEVIDLLDAPAEQTSAWEHAIGDRRLDSVELRAALAATSPDAPSRARLLDALEPDLSDAELQRWFASDDAHLRRWAVQAVVERGCQAPSCLHAYATLLRGDDVRDVIAAGPALLALRAPERRVLVAELLKHEDAAVRAIGTHYGGIACDEEIGEALVDSLRHAADPFAVHELGEAVARCPESTQELAKREWRGHPLGASAWQGTGLEGW